MRGDLGVSKNGFAKKVEKDELNKKKKTRRAVACALGTCAAAAILTASYFSFSMREGTVVNGVDVSGMWVTAASEKIAGEVIGDAEFKVLRRDGETFTVKAEDISLRYDTKDLLNVDMGSASHLLPVYDVEKLKEVLDASGIFDGTEEPKNAEIGTDEDGGFVIVPDGGGNIIEEKEQAVAFVSAEIRRRIQSGEYGKVIEMPDSVYKNAEIREDDEKLVKTKDVLNLIAYNSIALDMGGGKWEQVCIKDYADIDISGRWTLNEKKLRKFVKGLAAEYDTMWQDRTITLPNGEQLTVKSTEYDTFGYELDVDGTVELIKDAIEEGDKETFAAHYTGGATRGGNGNDIGDSYILVDITNQVLVAVKDGEILITSDVTTGRETDPKWNTPQGIFRIWQHERNTYLTGTTAAGDTYNQFVYYWMEFSYTGCGLHDAFWRDEFGGDLYHENGSYGCVNCPSYLAEVLFDNYDIGTPVLIYKDGPMIEAVRQHLKEEMREDDGGYEGYGTYARNRAHVDEADEDFEED